MARETLIKRIHEILDDPHPGLRAKIPYPFSSTSLLTVNEQIKKGFIPSEDRSYLRNMSCVELVAFFEKIVRLNYRQWG